MPEGYHMKQRTPLNELKNLTSSPQAFDGVLLFLPWDIMQQQQLFKKMQELFQVANQKGFNPLIIVTHIDKVDDESIRKRIKTDIAHTLRISENRIFLISNYVKEENKNFNIDKKNLIILEEIVRISNGKASTRKTPPSVMTYLSTAACVVFGFAVVAFLLTKTPVDNTNVGSPKPKRTSSVRLVEKEPEVEGELTQQTEEEEQDQTLDEDVVVHEEAAEVLSPDEEEELNASSAHKTVMVKVFSGASKQFRIGRTTTVRSLLQQAKKVFANPEEKEDWYLGDQKGATYVENDVAWDAVGSVFYMNKHTTA